MSDFCTLYKFQTDVVIILFSTWSIIERDEDEYSFNLLDVAWRNNDVELALYLINHGCSVSDEDKVKWLCKACQKGELKIVRDLVEQHSVNPKGEALSLVVFYRTCIGSINSCCYPTCSVECTIPSVTVVVLQDALITLD